MKPHNYPFVLRLLRCLFVFVVIMAICSTTLPALQRQMHTSSTGTLSWETLTVGMKSAPFPHPQRANGYTYNNATYPTERHYRDSSVMIVLPQGWKPSQKLDIIVYLHGWYNSIDSANVQFRIAEQFAESRKNAVLVFPEGPRFAPDSFGGKLEDSCGLQRLLQETMTVLREKCGVKGGSVGNVILAGHSGAYRAIAFMLLRGNTPVREVWLFDALYGHTEKFTHWLEHDCKRLRGRFINIYTDDGGTKSETEKCIADLRAWRLPHSEHTEQTLTPQDLTRSPAVFIHTDLTHNDVVARRSQFRIFLETSCLRRIQEK